MSNKTKIVVLHLREIIYAGIFALLAILFLVIMVVMFFPSNKENDPEAETEEQSAESKYRSGVYTSSLNLGSSIITIQVVIDESGIIAIDSIYSNETVDALYPLLKPSLENLESQIVKNQSTENLTYSDEAKYTSLCLISSINDALSKAENEPATTQTGNME